VLSAVANGVLHDQVAAPVSFESFTVGHPGVIDMRSPMLLGLFCGVSSTSWPGALVTVPIALAVRSGARRTRSARSLLAPVVGLLAVMTCCAAVAGPIGHVLTRSGVVFLTEPFATRVATEDHDSFLTALWAQLASSAAGLLGGPFTAWRVWRSREEAGPDGSACRPVRQ